MYAGRFWVAFGTGQNLNEHITGDRWPSKPERKDRLKDAVTLIRALWAGETVDFDGPWFRVKDAKLYTRPQMPPLIDGAAITPESAEWVGGSADGLITVAKEQEELRRVVDAFRLGGGEGKPMALQAAISFAMDEEQQLLAAHHRWPIAAVDLLKTQDLTSPRDFDREVAANRPEDLKEGLRISADLGRHIDWLMRDAELGFDEAYLHHVGPDPLGFLEAFAAHVLPVFAD